MDDLALIVRTVDYRGDHATDCALIVRVPLTATVSDLLKIADKHSSYCRAFIEVKRETPSAGETERA